MQNRTIAVLSLFTLTAAVLTACSAPEQATDPSASSAADVGTLSLGWTPGPAGAAIPVTADEGYWEDEGLTVDINNFNSGREALESLLGGGVDVAILAELPAVTAALNEQPVVVVDSLSTFDAYRVIGSSAHGITDDLSSLDGKKIATTVGTNMQFVTDELLTEAGVDAEIVNVGAADIVAALSRGDVDAAVMFESFYNGAEEALGDDYVEIPISPDLYTGNMLVAVQQSAIDENPEAVQALVDGLVKGADYVEANASDAQEKLISAAPTLTTDYLATVWDNYDFTPELPDALVALMVREGLWVQKQGNAGQGVTVDEDFFTPIVDTTFLDAARN